MAGSSRSGNEPDGRHGVSQDWLDDFADVTKRDVSRDAARADTRSSDIDDWIASLQDLELTWNTTTGAHEERSARPADDWLEALTDEFQTRGRTDAESGTATNLAAWSRMASDEDAHVEVNDIPPQSPAETGEWFDTDPEDGPSVADGAGEPLDAPLPASTRAPRSRRRLVIVAAAAGLLLGGATAVVALVGHGDGGDAARNAAISNRNRGSATTTPAVGSTTNVVPTTAPAGSTLPPAPQSFTVQSTCGTRSCGLEMRAGPAKTAQHVSNLRSGQVVQIECSVHGEQVRDSDTGNQSDLWYRYAGTHSYSSALYLQGPPVPSCSTP
jgi:hypothetical protein